MPSALSLEHRIILLNCKGGAERLPAMFFHKHCNLLNAFSLIAGALNGEMAERLKAPSC